MIKKYMYLNTKRQYTDYEQIMPPANIIRNTKNRKHLFILKKKKSVFKRYDFPFYANNLLFLSNICITSNLIIFTEFLMCLRLID